MKKYSMTLDKHTGLYRITLLIDLPGFKAGSVGGLIEKEANLYHEGNAWVFGNARVYGNSKVFGDSLVSGNSWVYGDSRVFGDSQVSGDSLVSGNSWVSGDSLVSGNSWVSGNAQVYGNSWVSGNAQVFGDAWNTSPLYIQGSQHSLTNSSYGKLTIGCETHTFDEWLENFETIGKKNGYTKIEIVEYHEYIKLFKKVGR